MVCRTWIITVNYGASELVLDSLRSLRGQVGDLAGGQVVVLDNASPDASLERLGEAIARENWSDWVQLLPLERNGGFAYGNNTGIQFALSNSAPPDFILLLNPDTIVRTGAIRALVAFMGNHPDVGIAGSLLENPAGGVECSAHRTHSPLSELDGGARLGVLSRLLQGHVVSEEPRLEAHACDWVSGASMIIRRQVIENIGLMDEGYFLYFEEVDFCCRARAAGWSVWYVPESRVLHLEGASTHIHASAERRASYWYDSRRRFFLKHYGITGLLLADLLWTVGRLSFLVRVGLGLTKGGGAADPKHFMFDLLWGDLRALLRGQAGAIGHSGE